MFSKTEVLNGDLGNTNNRFLTNLEVEKAINDVIDSFNSFKDLSQQNFESLKNATNESSKTFVLDGFNPYDPFH